MTSTKYEHYNMIRKKEEIPRGVLTTLHNPAPPATEYGPGILLADLPPVRRAQKLCGLVTSCANQVPFYITSPTRSPNMPQWSLYMKRPRAGRSTNSTILGDHLCMIAVLQKINYCGSLR